VIDISFRKHHKDSEQPSENMSMNEEHEHGSVFEKDSNSSNSDKENSNIRNNISTKKTPALNKAKSKTTVPAKPIKNIR
jgi:hypothetical protein